MIFEPQALSFLVGALLLAFGATIGSFLNVVAWRLPRGESVVSPASHCTSCGTPVPWWGLVPIFGWMLVRARCVKCHEKVSVVYPIVEALCGIGTVALFFHHASAEELVNALSGMGGGAGEASLNGTGATLGRFRFGFLPPLFASLWLLYTAIPLVMIDLKYRLLPDAITLPGALVAFVIALALPDIGWKGALLGIAVGSGGLFTIAKGYELLRRREGLGMGDVKYLALIGALVGWQGVIMTIAIASCLGALVGIALGLIRKEGLQTVIPFGPFLAFGALAVNLFGDEIQLLLYG